LTRTRFFIALLHSEGVFEGYGVSLSDKEVNPPPTPGKLPDPPNTFEGVPATFGDVFSSFVSVFWTYRSFLQVMLAAMPRVSGALAEAKIGDFARAKGRKRDDLSDAGKTVFEMKLGTFRELLVHQDEILAATRGANLLPEVMLIGLISAYDCFLGNLLRVVLRRHEEIVLTSEKTIKYSELVEFGSIENARTALIDREIESVLRDSHEDHFRWMETKFKTTLTHLAAFPAFIEICERRNLITHTGGVVSAKYIQNCKAHHALSSGIELGTKLSVDDAYYSKAVDTVCEVGFKLCYVLWRRFAKEEKAQADARLNEFCYDLIVRRHYALAEAILGFSTDVLKKAGDDACRRRMIVNRANAVRLQKRESEAIKLLDAEDWSAVNDEFAVSVAAVRSQVDRVAAFINKIGPHGRPNAEDYRTWPVFRGLRSNPIFAEAFENVFGEPLITPPSEEIQSLQRPDKPVVH
jgi:hypothetical protein